MRNWKRGQLERVYIVRTQTVGAGPWLVSEVARKQEAATGWVTGWRVSSGTSASREQQPSPGTETPRSPPEQGNSECTTGPLRAHWPMRPALLPYDVATPTTPQGRYPKLHVQLTCRTSFLVATRSSVVSAPSPSSCLPAPQSRFHTASCPNSTAAAHNRPSRWCDGLPN